MLNIHLIVKVRHRYAVVKTQARWRVIYDAPITDEGAVARILEAYRAERSYPLDRWEYSYTVEHTGKY